MTSRKMMTLEKLEADMMAVTATTERVMIHAGDLEAQFMATTNDEKIVPDVVDINERMAHPDSESDADRLDEDVKEYNGLMLQYEKDLIAKIQLSQALQSNATVGSDYYYQAFMALSQPTNAEVKPENADTQQDKIAQERKYSELLQQVTAHNNNRRRSQAKSQGESGVLGKIALNSLRKPKQLLDVTPVKSAPVTEVVKSEESNMHQSPFRVLKLIESCYATLMHLDDLYREFQRDKTPATPEVQQKRNLRFTTYIRTVWQLVYSFSQPQLSHQQLTDAERAALLKQMPQPLGLSTMYRYVKGRRLVQYMLKYLPREQTILLLSGTILAVRTIQLTAAPSDTEAVVRELEDFSSQVVFPFVNLLAAVDLAFINGLMQHMQSTGGVMSLARVKPGLLFLTLLVSRAEIVKTQAAEGDDGLKQQVAQWTGTVYPALFSELESRFESLFPPTHVMPSLFDSAKQQRKSLSKPVQQIDDSYVWQFLAAVSAGATEAQHRTLVTETRDKIFESITNGGAAGVQKVNIFLHALDLDASQLMQ